MIATFNVNILSRVFTIEIVYVLLNFLPSPKKSKYIRGFWSILRTHMILAINQRCNPPGAMPTLSW